MFCKFCGKELRDGSKFCKFCGEKLPEKSPKQRKNIKVPGFIKKVLKWIKTPTRLKKLALVSAFMLMLDVVCAFIITASNKAIDASDYAFPEFSITMQANMANKVYSFSESDVSRYIYTANGLEFKAYVYKMVDSYESEQGDTAITKGDDTDGTHYVYRSIYKDKCAYAFLFMFNDRTVYEDVCEEWLRSIEITPITYA